MEDDPVSIESHYSPNPSEQENYTVTCYSHRVCTTVTARPSVVRQWVGKIRYKHRYQLRSGRLTVGLGVQWSPENNINPTPATLQLCVGHDYLVFQLEYADHSPLALRCFLADSDVTFVGIRNYRDAQILSDCRHRLRISRLVDVRVVAHDLRGCSRGASMETLAEDLLDMDGVEKKEWVGRSDWDEECLSQEQVEYACIDVFMAFLMGKELRAWKWDEDS